MKKVASLVFASVLGGALALGGYFLLVEKNDDSIGFNLKTAKPRVFNTNYIPTATNTSGELEAVDFTVAAEETVNAVVHVKNMAIRSANPLEFFYGRRSNSGQKAMVGAGSGVIISPDGYIVTNNHVIEGASDIEISLNNQKNLKAEVIGKDQKNDIALLKVDYGEDLPFVPFGNSDNIKIGEWVLAVGNPLNLTSTVTAGIISAKGRDIEGNSNIDSFIQTDAAVNSGNSGGALVNTRGELIGINTAITSRTGSFIGYSFAVPSNIAKKVIDDLLEYGNVQEALIGINIADDKGIEGVKVAGVEEDGGAEKAGLRADDIITKIGDIKIKQFSDLKGQLSAKRPGDKVAVTVLRDGSELTKEVVLTKKNTYIINQLAIQVKDLSKKDKKIHDVKYGAKITQNENKYLKYYGIEPGFIITKINGEKVKNAEDAKVKTDATLKSYGPFNVEMIDLKGEKKIYPFRE